MTHLSAQILGPPSVNASNTADQHIAGPPANVISNTATKSLTNVTTDAGGN